MRIIHVEDYFDPTAGYQINELLNASKSFNDEVFLITSNCMKPFHKELDIDKDKEFERKTGVKIIRLEAKLIISSRVILKNLHKKINEINPQIVFFHGIGDFKDIILWKKKRKYRIFRDCHMSWVASQNRFKNIYYKMFKLFFARIINNTEKYCKVYALGEEEYEYLRTIGVRDDKIEYLYHGYNEDVMYFNEDERKYIRDKYSINKDDIVISYIGKFDESKRPDIIFDIVNKLDQEYVDNKNIKLLFIGPKNQIYMDIFNKKRIESKITIEIIVDESKPFAELRKYFSASDICIFPKACTLSSIHAQVCGCKVIMENHKSNRERVIESENLYEIDNIIKASEILKKCIEDINAKQERIYVKGLEEREYKNQVCLLRKCIKEKEQI